MTVEVPITIIGGGAVGCAIAYEFSRNGIQDVVVLDRNTRIPGENQSSRNSGVVHAGIYYPRSTEPKKARLCVEGNTLLYEFCSRFAIPHRKTGKLVVAANTREEEYLDDLLATALENDVPDVHRITRAEIRAMEPNVQAISALYVPTSGIIEPTAFVSKLAALAQAQGAYVLPSKTVSRIEPNSDAVTITTVDDEQFTTAMLINAAGLYAADIARMINPTSPSGIVPVRGEAAKFDHTARPEITMRGMNVYPAPHGYYLATGQKADVPLAEFKRLQAAGLVKRTVGAHLTPTFAFARGDAVIGSTVTVGPLKRAGYGPEDYTSDLIPEEQYLSNVQSYFPALRLSDIILHQTGIMAVPIGGNDWIIARDSQHQNCINLIGIDSPGLTASLAIAKHVGEMIKEGST